MKPRVREDLDPNELFPDDRLPSGSRPTEEAGKDLRWSLLGHGCCRVGEREEGRRADAREAGIDDKRLEEGSVVGEVVDLAQGRYAVDDSEEGRAGEKERSS